MNTEIIKNLEKIALNKTIPFCYECYKEAPTGRCNSCGSDDLMRLLRGEGCEFGLLWVIESLLLEALEPVDIKSAFQDSVTECHPETTTVGWMTLDTISILKEMDPVSWDIARSEWESAEEADGNIISFDHGSTYYWRSEVESFIEREV